MRKALLAIFLLFSFNLYGAGAKIDIPKYDWSWKGFFGTYDRASAQRGLKVYREVCAGCHSMNYLSYRNLADLGFLVSFCGFSIFALATFFNSDLPTSVSPGKGVSPFKSFLKALAALISSELIGFFF